MKIDNTAPATVFEAVERLHDTLTDLDKHLLRTRDSDYLHHTVMRNVRNVWRLWDPDSPLVRHARETFGVSHADDVSGLIMGALAAKVVGERFDFTSTAMGYRKHWLAQGCDPLSGRSRGGDDAPNVVTLRTSGFTPNLAARPQVAKPGLLQRLFGR